MSTKTACFAVEGAISDDEMLAGVHTFLDVCDRLRDRMVVEIEHVAPGHLLRYFRLLGSPRGGYVYDLEPFLEAFVSPSRPLVVLLHDDQHGVYLFERWSNGERDLSILSDGPYVGTTSCQITVDFVQKRRSRDEIIALHDKPYDQLTQEERNVIERWEDAITIGLRQCYPGEGRRYLREAWKHSVTYELVTGGRACTPQRSDSPTGLVNLIDYVPPDSRWESACLPFRMY